MLRRRRPTALAAAIGLGFTLAGSGIAAARTATPGPGSSPAAAAVAWQACPQYSDETLGFLGIRPDDQARFRELWARTECGTVSVPLDHRQPGGERISVALTRLKAKDRANRLGVLAMNPGGPGAGGYLMPITTIVDNQAAARLNDKYDLIGFDPRGVGYSTSHSCPGDPGGGAGEAGTGPLTRAEFAARYAGTAADNAACSASNARFLARLTTADAARDLDLVRKALREPVMNFVGVSWGTQLGAVYRSMFPARTGRMWLDSVVSPRAHDLAYRFGFTAGIVERNFGLFAQWLADRNSTYGLGGTAQEVAAEVLAMRRRADADPWRFTDIATPLDGLLVAFLASAVDLEYEQAAQVLHDLRTAVDGGPAPASVKQVAGGLGEGPPPPPEGAPEPFNATAQLAYLCNEDTSTRALEPLWDEYRDHLRDHPVTGAWTVQRPMCAGWTLPPQRFELGRGGSPVLSGHVNEYLTPYPWTGQMRERIGGTVFTVKDFAHGSVLYAPDCTSHLVAYFETGEPGGLSCEGLKPRSGKTGALAFGR
ncbi:alpha/beta fold hydrolase [Yinghuangia soli]|uniref:Alpha/beta hydrolase n=1 Tax=Yinghuangia soli TaxID=2908204 RepID=A0AA41U911_9ACTN|nr:alpha/beta fold hydrolase [Yinghuangia soli]MCF2533429.1 alpha/beta hydrolase [Yinghuangia soli]